MKIGESFILIGQQEALRREGEAGVFSDDEGDVVDPAAGHPFIANSVTAFTGAEYLSPGIGLPFKR
jgi:hypothetical protein